MSTELTTQLPEHLQRAIANKGNQASGLEEMANYIVPPRLKVVQDKKDDERFEDVPSGTVVVIPQMLRLCGKGESFRFTPIYAWDEFTIHNPYQMRSTLPFIRERTVDPKSEIADRARNREEFPCPESEAHFCKYVTHLNFLLAIHDVPDLAGIEVLISFHTGEFKTGQHLLNLLRMRTNTGVPMYGVVLEATPGKHTSGTNNWMGLDISNPTADYEPGPWVTDGALYGRFEAAHELAKQNKARIQADHEDAPQDAATAPESDTL